MGSNEMSIAKLDDARLQKLRAAERDMGVVLVALQPQYSYASLSEDQVDRLELLEKELGVVLLAYRPPQA